MRLPRTHSMTRRQDFLRVRTTGQAKAGRFVVLSTLADPALEHLMVAFITTRKTGKAHDRNLLRRRFRAMIQQHGELFSDDKRYLITIARPGAAKADFAELERDWLRQARRLGLIPRPGA
jgi:ribonuclease P protein component